MTTSKSDIYVMLIIIKNIYSIFYCQTKYENTN